MVTATSSLGGETAMYGVMEGVRVVELAAWTFVPAAGAVLADWGADVVKIEHPATGDPQRGLFTMSLAGAPDIMIQQPNRGKRSVAIDLATDAGHEIMMRLLESADVFLTNMRMDALRKLRLDVDHVRARNPRIIVARGSGQGTRGPDADKGGFDLASAWARSGMAYQLMHGKSEEPLRFPPAFIDIQGGLTIAGAISAALFRRERTGVPTEIDVSLFAVGSWMMFPDILASEYGGGILTAGRYDVVNPGVNSYRTKDGRWLYMVLLQSDRYWAEFCATIGRPDLAEDPRFATSAARAENNRACVEALDEVFAQRTLAEWREAFETFDGVWAPLQSPAEVHDDPQATASGIFTEVVDGERRFKLVSSPVQFGGEPLTGVQPAPEVGEHTDAVLQELGYSWDEVIELKVADVVL